VDVITEEEAPRDLSEAVRVGLVLVALALNIWIMWDYVRDRPEILAARGRIVQWWGKVVVTPQAAAARVRKMERETVFEALQIVDGEA
jgi:hypothetical protein